MWNWEETAIVKLESSSVQIGVLKSTVREEGIERDMRKIFKMLRKV